MTTQRRMEPRNIMTGLRRVARRMAKARWLSPRLGPTLVLDCHPYRRSEALVSGLPNAGTVYRPIHDLSMTIETSRVSVRVSGDPTEYRAVQLIGIPTPAPAAVGTMAGYLRTQGARVSGLPSGLPDSYLSHHMRMADAGIPVPKTIYLPPEQLAYAYEHIGSELWHPFVVKSACTGKVSSYRIRNADDLFCRVVDPDNAGIQFLAQRYVPALYTFELLVVTGAVHLALVRGNPISMGPDIRVSRRAALVDLTRFDRSTRRLAERAARILGSDFALVELIQDCQTQQWQVLAVADSLSEDGTPVPLVLIEAYARYVERRRAPNRTTGRK